MPTEQEILNSIKGSTNSSKPAEPEPTEDYSKTRETSAFIWETVKVIIISLAIILPIRYYLVQPFFVKGASMEDNLHDGDYLLIDEISYRFNDPKRGDIIVFRYPENPSQFFIKRIIGLPGETVEIKNDEVTIYNDDFKQGLKLEENYLSLNQQTIGNLRSELDGDEYFVLGDNRLQSSDSRRWGELNKSFITGKAFLRLWPFNRLTKIPVISY